MAKTELNQRHLTVLLGLNEQGKISRSQVTVGPLRHVDQKERKRILDDLRSMRYIEVLEEKPSRGPTASYFRITEAGRAALQNHAA